MAHPVDKEKAEALKAEGNKLYVDKKYEEALGKYSEALIYDHQNVSINLTLGSYPQEHGGLLPAS